MLLPTNVIKANLGLDVNGRVQIFFTQNCYRHMDGYIPKDNGELRDNVTLKPDAVIYKSSHAHPQYVGIVNGSPVKNYTTPGTGPYWDKRMWSAEKDVVIKETQEYLEGKRNG